MWQQEPTGDSPLGMSASTAVRFGIVPDQNLPWQTLVERWRLFEELGFDSAWDCDHFIQPSRPTGPYFEAWTQLAGASAGHTPILMRVRLVPTNSHSQHLHIH